MDKAFASLSSGLLARKGAAKPAMRPQGFSQMGASLEDLGWNDMGFEAPKAAVAAQPRDENHDAFGAVVPEQPLRSPVAGLTPSPVHGQQAELAQRLAEADDEGEEETADEADAVSLVEPAPIQPEALAPAPIQPPELEAPAPRPVVLRLAEPADRAPIPVSAPRPPSGPKAAFTLRLDADRHLRLRLACAVAGRSAQMMVTEAVDRLLADFPELESFAGQLPPDRRQRCARG